jgi:hypothetical protein
MKPFLSTIYCDDIRQEVGGKLSLMGVYNGVMYVQQFPVTLAKFWVVATFVASKDESPKSLKFRVFKNDEPLADLDATPEHLQQLATAREPVVPMPDGSRRTISTQTQVCFTPLQLDGPCLLSVGAMTDKGEVRGLGLQVQQQPSNHGN